MIPPLNENILCFKKMFTLAASFIYMGHEIYFHGILIYLGGRDNKYLLQAIFKIYNPKNKSEEKEGYLRK
ncbi:MAG TPA: hypothetical protein DDW50_10275 [Firmicutes bacterium]|nr:hypothetical protein [Bacillota bacterium]